MDLNLCPRNSRGSPARRPARGGRAPGELLDSSNPGGRAEITRAQWICLTFGAYAAFNALEPLERVEQPLSEMVQLYISLFRGGSEPLVDLEVVQAAHTPEQSSIEVVPLTL